MLSPALTGVIFYAVMVCIVMIFLYSHAEIFTELINGDTYLIKKCSETEDPKLELARIINEINERVL